MNLKKMRRDYAYSMAMYAQMGTKFQGIMKTNSRDRYAARQHLGFRYDPLLVKQGVPSSEILKKAEDAMNTLSRKVKEKLKK